MLESAHRRSNLAADVVRRARETPSRVGKAEEAHEKWRPPPARSPWWGGGCAGGGEAARALDAGSIGVTGEGSRVDLRVGIPEVGVLAPEEPMVVEANSQ